MNKKILALIAGTVACISVFFALGYNRSKSDSGRSVNEVNSLQTITYDATTEYEEAVKKYEEGCLPAKIIRDAEESEDKEVALVFEGMSDTVITEKLLSLLDEHDVKATFAVSAMEAGEDSDTLQLISQKEHEIADCGLKGESAMEALSDEELIYNFTHSRKVFTTLLNKDPGLMMLSRTLYTDGVCTSASAAGYDTVIAPTHYLNRTSFKDYDMTTQYVSRLKGSTILVIKMQGYLDALEMEPKVEERDPAKDKKASVDVKEEKEEKTEEDILKLTEWLLRALEENEIGTVMASSMESMTNDEYLNSLFEEGKGIKANVYRNVATIENIVGLTFKGTASDVETMDEILKYLTENEAKATFFVSAKDIEEHPDQVEKIAEAGFPIATLGTDGRDLSREDKYAIYEDLSMAQRAVRSSVSLKCRYYMPQGEVTDDMLIAAGAAGLSVVIPDPALSTDKGSISLCKLEGNYALKTLEGYISKTKTNHTTVADVTELIRKTETIPVIEQEVLDKLREENEERSARESNFVYTTEKAVVLCFYGVSNKPVVKDILNVLNERGYKGTFFVTADDMKNCTEQIDLIIEAGQEIGLAYIENDRYPAQYDVVASYILGSKQFMEWKYATDTDLVFQPYGEVADETKEAVSATGCTLVGHEFTLVQSDYIDSKDVNDFYGKYSSKIHAHRGSIAYISMNNFTADKELDPDYEGETLAGNLLRTFIRKNIDTLVYRDYQGVYQSSTAYSVRNYSSVANTGYTYSPGRAGSNRTITMNNSVLGNMGSVEEQNAYMFSRYIGNSSVTVVPGFTEQECKSMDSSGYITNDRTIFLTFDDWGNDSDLNQLFYVMNKYGVKGTFFVRTNHVSSNPNLLRAMAVEGHAIASHTHSHMQLSVPDTSKPDEYAYLSLSEEQAKVLRRDLVTSYDVLNRYVGDMTVNGKKSLTTLFRSPTLAASRIGMYQVFDTGFSYMVSGSLSTQDYKAGSVDELVNELRNGRKEWNGVNKVGNGTCIVMHMSPDARYTAEALDIMIPEWQAQGYTFSRLDDYLK